MYSILFVSSVGVLGGAERSLLHLASGLDRRRFEPLLVTLGDGDLVSAARSAGITTRVLPVPRMFARTSLRGRRSSTTGLLAGAAAAIPLVAALRAVIRECGPVIVHTNGNKAHVIGTAAAAGSRVPVVWHIRDFLVDKPFERLLVHIGRRTATTVIANSTAVGRRCEALGIRRERLHVIANGIDCDTFSPDGPAAPLRQQFGWPAATRLVVTVGALAPWKGQEAFLDAAALVHRADPSTRFVIVGGELYVTDGHGGYAETLRRRAQALGIDPVVSFAGQRGDVADVFRAADVAVHAPREPEPFGRVVAEAMACARPVVTVLDGGIADIAGGDGIVAAVPANDVLALARAIIATLGDPNAEMRAARGRTRIVEHFNAAAHVRRVEALYERVLSPKAAAAAA